MKGIRLMVKHNISVRVASKADIGTIVSFNKRMAFETENITLSEDRLTKGVAAVFEDKTKGFYIVAECDGYVVGQAMITYEWSDWRNSLFWWIQSVYVLPGYRRAGVFRAIFMQIKSMAENESKTCGLRLYVEKNNAVAKQTYENLGMRESHYDLFEIPLNDQERREK